MDGSGMVGGAYHRPLMLATSVWNWRERRPLAPPSRKEDLMGGSNSFLRFLFSSVKHQKVWARTKRRQVQKEMLPQFLAVSWRQGPTEDQQGWKNTFYKFLFIIQPIIWEVVCQCQRKPSSTGGSGHAPSVQAVLSLQSLWFYSDWLEKSH